MGAYIQYNHLAPQWDDAVGNINAVKLDPTNPPIAVAYHDGYVLEFPETANKKLYFTIQLSHSYQESSAIEFHIHYAIETNGAGAGAENVKFNLTHSWSNVNGEIPASTPLDATFDVQNYVDDTHYLGEIAASISGAGKTVSSILLCSLERDTAVANNYGASVYLLSLDFHIKKDSLGSNLETSKAD